MLLDWGFALPAATSVGRLVTPEEAAALHSPPPPTPAPSATPVAQPAGAYSIWPTVLAVAAVAFTAVAVATYTLIRRRRRV
jgi:D-alanyl-D-alanine carboxypeptidase (penicillin-binding protein 5/6)